MTSDIIELLLKETEDNEQTCGLCIDLAQSTNPQHLCHICKVPVCSVFCSVQDPQSENEMHRIHKKKCYELRNPNKEDDLSCSHCDGIFKSKDDLQHHTLRVHEFRESFRIYPDKVYLDR